jgi:hypothetical protein
MVPSFSADCTLGLLQPLSFRVSVSVEPLSLVSQATEEKNPYLCS